MPEVLMIRHDWQQHLPVLQDHCHPMQLSSGEMLQKDLLWRMEGVEIPNPSHFANVTTFGGGGITALSSQMLSNSDFYTGAFPAEFGNALSGVFDMKMRTGNNEKREHTIKGRDYWN